MHAPEKRRGGSHVLRAGPPHAGRLGTGGGGVGSSSGSGNALTGNALSGNALSSNNAGGSSNTKAGLSGNLPAMPPRVAMVNGNNAASAVEQPHDGAERREWERDRDKDRGKDRGKDSPGPSSSSGHCGSGTTTTATREKHGSGGSGNGSGNSRELRERDDRIAHLEAEMKMKEREFHRQVEKSESETAKFWQAKHSALYQQFLHTDTELRLLRTEVEARDAERQELRQGWEVLRRELRGRDVEIRDLRSQVRGLKEFVSTSTRTDGQTSDEVFGDGMAKLGNGLQNWVIINFRKARLDLSTVHQATLAELGELVPMYEDLAHAAKVHLLQSVVSRILVDMVFNAYFVGLSDEETCHFKRMEQLLCSFDASDEAVNQWRSSTLALLRRDAPQLLHSGTSAFVEVVISRTNRLLDAITAPSPSSDHAPAPQRSEARDSALRVLVNNSIELARLLAVQKAVLRMHIPDVLPHQRVLFEPETMEDVGGVDEEALTRREIWCVVFPGLIKHGDENGGQMQFRNVIAKARVFCNPGE